MFNVSCLKAKVFLGDILHTFKVQKIIFSLLCCLFLQAPSFSAPKPFSYTPAAPFAPAAAAPPNAGPMSPSSYPPAQPTWTPSAAPAPVAAAPKPVPVSTGPSQGAY